MKPIGQSMIEANLINQYQLDELLEYQNRSEERIPLGRLTVDLGVVKDEDFAPFIASYFDVPYANLNSYSKVQPEAINSLPQSIAKRLNVVPISREDDTLTVAMHDPLDLLTVENLETVTRCRIRRVVSSLKQIKESIESFYTGVFLKPAGGSDQDNAQSIFDKRYKYSWPLAPSLIRLLIERAHKNSVTSIHIQPEKNRIEIFFRNDKKLDKIASYPLGALSSISSFIKMAAKLDSSISDAPQSGYFVFNVDRLNIEVGVSVLPLILGERIVLEVPRRIGWMDEDTWFKAV